MTNKQKLGKSILVVMMIIVSNFTYAQHETEENKLTITIGDTITFTNVCDSGVYKKIDMYTKTRYIDTILTFDQMTGDGFYKTFFAEGDFDAKRLPCTYANQKFTVTSAQYFTDNNTGADRFVVFVLLDEWNKVAWIEFIDALEAGEILLK